MRAHQSTIKLGGQTLYAALGGLFTLAVGLPLQIYITRKIGVDGVGLLGVVEGAIATISTLLGFGIAPTTVRFLPWHIERKEYGAARDLVLWSILLLAVVGLVSYGGLLVGLNWLDRWWPELADHRALVIVMGLGMPLGFLIFLFMQMLRGFHDIRYMIIGSAVVQLIAKAGFTIALLSLGWGVMGAATAMVLATACAVVWMAIGVIKHLRSLPYGSDHGDRRQWIRYAMISYANGIVSGLPAYFDRFVIAYLVGVDAVGILVVARKLQGLPQMPMQMLLSVGAPMMAAAHGRNDRVEQQHVYDLMKDWLVRVSLPLLIFLAVFCQPIMGVFGIASRQAGLVLLILVIGQFINNLSGPIGTIATMSGLEKPVLTINIATTGTGFLLLFVLAPLYGAPGAATALVLGWAALAGTLMVLVRKKLGLRWWNPKVRRWIGPAILTTLVALAIRYSHLSVETVSLAAYLGVLHAVYFGSELIQGLDDDDRELFEHLRKRISSPMWRKA